MDYSQYVTATDVPTDPREAGIGTVNSRPQRTMRPLVEGLRFNHFKHDGKFDNTAKRNLIQDLFRCLSGFEDLWTDPDDPEFGKACFKAYDFHRVGLSDEFLGIPRPFSVRNLQIRQQIARDDEEPPLQRPRYGRKCGKIIPRMASFYTCKTCFRDISSLLCTDCFQRGDHEGHDVTFRTNYNFAPVCDCGAIDLYKDTEDGHPDCCLDHPRHPDPAKNIQAKWNAGSTDSAAVTEEFVRALYDVFVVCIEYIIETFQSAPPPENYGKLPKDLKEMTTAWGLNYTCLDDAAKRAEGPWSVAVFTDERHNEPELLRQMQHATGADMDDCQDWVTEMDTLGRKVVKTVSSPTVAFHFANMFQQIDIPVSLRHAYDMYRESAAATILEWLADICECHVGGDPDLTTKIMSQVLREDRHFNSGGHRVAPDLRRLLKASEGKPDQPRSRIRLDWMWHIDNRLWKQPKLLTKAIYAKMMTIHPSNMEFMLNRFSLHYINLAQEYLTAERDSDTSLYQFLAYSLFSNGSAIAKANQKRGLLITMVEVLEAWYRHMSGDFRDKIPCRPQGPVDSVRRDVHLRVIGHKNKKGIYLLAHLRGILMLDKVAQHVASSHTLISRMGQFVDLFIGMQPQGHETQFHVSYEVDWYKGFNLMAELAKTLKQLGECYTKAKPDLLYDIVRFMMARIIYDIQLRSDTLDPDRYTEPVFRPLQYTYGDDEYDAKKPWHFIENQLHGIDAFSFHHYNHYLLGELIHSLVAALANNNEQVDFPKMMTNLVATCDSDYIDWFEPIRSYSIYPERTQQMMLLIIEQPLSKYIVGRHIRADRWKRNGSTMRHQLNAYVDVQRREATNDQEFYILQTALCTMGPVPFVLAAMDRFGTMDDHPINANYMSQFIDPPGTVIDFEDFIWFLIYLVTDSDRPMQTHPESIVSRTISQILAIKPMTYAEIAKRMSERTNERVELSDLIRQMADYRGPTETAPGIYTLKPEYIPHVSPFWRHYTRNERKEVMDFVLKKTFETRPDLSVEFDQWFYIPGRIEIPEPPVPFSNLSEIFKSPISIYVLQVTFEHCMLMESDQPFFDIDFKRDDIPRFDSLFDMALHFAILAIHQEPEHFIRNALNVVGTKTKQDPGYKFTCPDKFGRNHCLYENLWYMEASDNPVYKPYRSRIEHLTKLMRESLAPEEVKRHQDITAARKSPPEGATAIEAPPDKTTAADRQKQVMEEFAKKQAAFAANMDFDDDDDEDMVDEDEAKVEVLHGPCIVCQDPLLPDRPGGLLALFQPSRIVRESVHDVDFFTKSLETPINLDDATRSLQYADLSERSYEAQKLDSHPPQSMRLGCYVSACGHYMHESCMEQYTEHTRSRHSHQLSRNQPENIVRYEYMCPLCKSISNFILPIDFEATPVGAVKIPENKEGGMLTLLEYIRMVSAEGLKYINDSTKIWQHHSEGGHVKAWFSDCSFRGNKDVRHTDMRLMSAMVDRFRHLYRALADQSHQIRGSNKPFYAPEDAVGYTVSVLEIAQRGLARGPGQLTVAEQLLDSSRNCIKRMLEMLKLELDGYFGRSYNQAGLRVAVFARFLPDWYRASSLPTSLLLRNPLSIVVEAAAIAPDLLHPVIIMAYYAEVIRALISISIMARRLVPNAREDTPSVDDPFLYDEGEYSDQARARFADFLPTAITLFRNATPYNDVDATLRAVPDAMLSKLVYMHTLPFVRRAAILYYAVHGKYVVTDPKDIITEGCEYDRLASLLAIPNPKDTLGDPNNTVELPMVLRWLTQWATGGRQVTSPEICGPYELLSLPEHMDEMILRYTDDVCSRCAREPQFPGLCMSCGEVICIGGDCCSQDDMGECNIHLRTCGAATGLFVDIKRCALIVLYAGTGSFLNMPYLDQHGDADGGGQKRGHRLILNEQRYEDIRRNVWLNLSIPHIIARKLEGVSDPGGWSAL